MKASVIPSAVASVTPAFAAVPAPDHAELLQEAIDRLVVAQESLTWIAEIVRTLRAEAPEHTRLRTLLEAAMYLADTAANDADCAVAELKTRGGT